MRFLFYSCFALLSLLAPTIYFWYALGCPLGFLFYLIYSLLCLPIKKIIWSYLWMLWVLRLLPKHTSWYSLFLFFGHTSSIHKVYPLSLVLFYSLFVFQQKKKDKRKSCSQSFLIFFQFPYFLFLRPFLLKFL